MSDAVVVERIDGVARITLNQPEKRNAMTLPMIEAFGGAVQALGDDRAVRAVVVTGAGTAFCAGADFAATAAMTERAGVSGAVGAQLAIRELYRAFLSIHRLPQPTIAAINGAAIGGGLGVALLCDIRIVATTATLAVNFARLGIHPGLGISALLPRAVGYEAAAELLFSGRSVTGAKAAQIGLARQAVDAEAVVPAAMELAREIAGCAPLAVREIKRTLRAAAGPLPDSVLQMEALAQANLSQTEDAREGVMALVQKRAPVFRGK